jgi:DNA polymerase-3 subunit epsilon
MSNEYAVIDFETTGLSANQCRIIEVAAVIVRNGKVADSFVQLMHPGHHIPSFITDLTGITNAMVKGKPKPEAVMPELKKFMGGCSCVAHNASFDSSFYHAEMSRAGIAHERSFFCTVKLSRRLIQDSPNHKLETLAEHLNLSRPTEGNCHRALYDVLLTVELWKRIESIIIERTGGRTPDHEIYKVIMKKPKATVQKYLDTMRSGGKADYKNTGTIVS